jgi:hypothetical protein
MLFGAAQGLRERVGFDVYAYYLPDDDGLRLAAQTARVTMGKDEYDDAVDQGRALEAEATIAFALHANRDS